MTTTETVLHALATERNYRLMRWGYRQPDGRLIEAPHSVADFVIYIQDYYAEARHKAARDAGIATALDGLRKVVCLGLACLEQWDTDDDGVLRSYDEIASDFLLDADHIMPRVLQGTQVPPDFSNYLLKIHAFIMDAAMYSECLNPESSLAAIRDMVKLCVECFEQYGIEERDLPVPIINAHDGQPT